MTRFSPTVYALAAFLALAGSSIASAQPASTAADPLAANAALFYWRAFALMPKLDEKQENAVAQYSAMDAKGVRAIDDSLEPVAKLSDPAMQELHRAAKQPRCVWATPVEDGVATLLPQVSKARELSRLAMFRARWNVAHGKTAEGVDDLIDAMTLARHLAAEPILINLLCTFTIENVADNVAAAELNRMGTAELRIFAEKLDSLPPGATTRQAVLGERDLFIDPIIRVLSQPDGKEKMFQEFGDVDAGDPSVKALKALSREQLLEGAKGVRPLYDKLAALMDQPLADVKKNEEKLAAWLADPSLSEPTRAMAKMILPGYSGVMKADVRYKLCLRLLRAAVAVKLEGPEALSNPAYHDPFANAPFQYEKLGDGFRLQSKTPNPKTGKPLALKTGKGFIGLL
jgi:hypothetical protein